MNGIGSIYDLTREELVEKYKKRIQALPKDVKRCWNGYVSMALFMAEWENMQSMFHVKTLERGATWRRKNNCHQNNT